MNSIPTTRQTCTQGNLIGRLLLILLAVSNLPGFAQAPLTPTVSLRSSATVDPDDMCFVRTSVIQSHHSRSLASDVGVGSVESSFVRLVRGANAIDV